MIPIAAGLHRVVVQVKTATMELITMVMVRLIATIFPAGLIRSALVAEVAEVEPKIAPTVLTTMVTVL